MSNRLEKSRAETKKLKETSLKLSEKTSRLEEQQQYIDVLSSETRKIDDFVSEKISSITASHSSELQRVKAEKSETSRKIEDLIKIVQDNITKLQDIIARSNFLHEQGFYSDYEKHKNIYGEHLSEWQSLLRELSDEKFSCDFSSQNFSLSTEKIAELERDINKHDVMSLQITWYASLSQEEKNALDAYTSSNAYKEINNYLRHSKDFSADVKDKRLSQIQALHHGLKSSIITHDIKVFRGFSSEAGIGKIISKIGIGHQQNLSRGNLLYDAGFMSTSFSKEISQVFADYAFLELTVPAGANGAYIGQYSLDYGYEKEFLLNCNQVIRIDDVKEFYGKPYLKGTLLTAHERTKGILRGSLEMPGNLRDNVRKVFEPDRFLYTHEDDLQVGKTQCEFCEYNNPEKNIYCPCYDGFKPIQVLSSKILCKFIRFLRRHFD